MYTNESQKAFETKSCISKGMTCRQVLRQSKQSHTIIVVCKRQFTRYDFHIELFALMYPINSLELEILESYITYPRQLFPVNWAVRKPFKLESRFEHAHTHCKSMPCDTSCCKREVNETQLNLPSLAFSFGCDLH